jgi:endonuclease/exonuclease/phosphatase family metal-dependent hydrolase
VATDRHNVEWLANRLSIKASFDNPEGRTHIAWLTSSQGSHCTPHKFSRVSWPAQDLQLSGSAWVVRMIATHLRAGQSQQDVNRRTARLDRLRRHLSLPIIEPLVVLSDFNSLDPRDVRRAQCSALHSAADKCLAELSITPTEVPTLHAVGLEDCFAQRHPCAPGHTFSSGDPWLRIDYIFVSPVMASKRSKCNVVYTQSAKDASDHFPVWAEFEL